MADLKFQNITSVRACEDISAYMTRLCDMYLLEPKDLLFELTAVHTMHSFDGVKYSHLKPADAKALLNSEARFERNDFYIKQLYDFHIYRKMTLEDAQRRAEMQDTKFVDENKRLQLIEALKIDECVTLEMDESKRTLRLKVASKRKIDIEKIFESVRRKMAYLKVLINEEVQFQALAQCLSSNGIAVSGAAQSQPNEPEIESEDEVGLEEVDLDSVAPDSESLGVELKSSESDYDENAEFVDFLTAHFTPKSRIRAEFMPKKSWEKAKREQFLANKELMLEYKNDIVKSVGLETTYYAVALKDEVLRVWREKNGESGRDLCGQFVACMDAFSTADKEGDKIANALIASNPALANAAFNADNKESQAAAKENAETLQEMPKINFDEALFEMVERDDYISYIARTKGYVSFSENTLRVIDKEEFSEVNLRTVGNLLGGVEKGLSLIITSSNPNNDAVGSNTTIEAANIDIVGSLGDKARVIGNIVKVHGQTHQNSFVKAENAEIDFHKGKLLAQHATIKKLELGIVDAAEAEIDEIVGGVVKAKELVVNKLHSHAKIYVSSKMNIGESCGGENELHITNKASFETRFVMERYDNQTSLYLSKINALLELFNHLNSEIKKTKPIIHQLKAIIDEKKRLGEQPDPKIHRAFQEYVAMVKQAKFAREAVFDIQARAKQKNDEIKKFDEGVKAAVIECASAWAKHNEVFLEHMSGRDLLNLNDGDRGTIVVKNDALALSTPAEKGK